MQSPEQGLEPPTIDTFHQSCQKRHCGLMDAWIHTQRELWNTGVALVR